MEFIATNKPRTTHVPILYPLSMAYKRNTIIADVKCQHWQLLSGILNKAYTYCGDIKEYSSDH